MSTFQIYERLKRSMSPEAAEAIAGALEEFAGDLQRMVTKEDFSELKQIVADLGAAQKRTEQRVEELAEAQKRTEQRLDSLAVKVEELAEAQKRTEQRVEELAEAMQKGFGEFDRRLAAFGSRWGDKAEEAFRQGLFEHVRDLGYTVEHYQGQDTEGFLSGRPRSYDLDILTFNGQTIATEIKSNADEWNVVAFARRVELFERQTGRKVNRSILVAVTIEREAFQAAEEFGLTVATGFEDLPKAR